MKFYGNIVLMTVICIVVFWMFMALRPAQAFGGAGQVGRYADIASGFAIILPLNIKRVSNEIARTCTLATAWKDACH